MVAPLETFDVERVRRDPALTEQAWTIESLAECGSTNTVLLDRIREGARHGTVLVAERQTGGRGRRGNVWRAPPETSLTFSALWRTGREPALFGLAPLAAGIACVQALEGLGATGLQLKWPNDIMRAAAKLGGILVETATHGQDSAIVVGIGINLAGARALSAELERPVADTAEAGVQAGREELLAAILNRLHRALGLFEEGCDGDLVQAWTRYDGLRGRPVRVTGAGPPMQGIARGIAADGALRLDTAEGIRSVYAGEASIA